MEPDDCPYYAQQFLGGRGGGLYLKLAADDDGIVYLTPDDLKILAPVIERLVSTKVEEEWQDLG